MSLTVVLVGLAVIVGFLVGELLGRLTDLAIAVVRRCVKIIKKANKKE